MMTISEINALIEKKAESILRTPGNWPSMERHDQTGSPLNLTFVPCPGVDPKELVNQMRASYVASVRSIVENIIGVSLRP